MSASETGKMPYAGRSGDLYYDDLGSGPAILFIPGFGGVGSFWNAQKQFFQSRFRVITVDHRGTGASARSKCTYSLEQMSEDVKLVLDAAAVNEVILIGHSTGGAIAQILAATMPDRVQGSVLSSTWCQTGNYFRRVFEFRRMLLERGEFDLFHKSGIFFRYSPSYSDDHDDVFESGSAPDVEITISRIDAILRSDTTDYASRITTPTLVMAVADDCLVPPFLTDAVARNIAHAQYVALDHGGHYFPITRSDRFNQILDWFLDSQVALMA
jgi:aminoacrylate hydrolase